METMFNYIEETPEQCLANINNSKELTKTIVGAFNSKDYKRVCIIACGSSYNASVTAKYFIEKVLKMKTEVITSFTVQNYETIFDKETFYIGIGQSGRSHNTNAAMTLVRENGCEVTGLTGNVESVMKDHCDYICNWGMGIEKIGFVTKGFSTAVLFFMLFAVEAGLSKNIITESEYNNYIDQLKQMANTVKEAIPVVYDWYSRNENKLYGFTRAQVLGYGPNFGVALEGSLKCEETMGVAFTGYEIEEYLHGPYYETNKTRSVFIIDSLGNPSERACKLYENLHMLTDNVFLITNKTYDDEKVLTINHNLDEFMSVFVNVLAFQVIAANGNKKWVNPIQETRLKFIDVMDAKSPKTGKELGL